MCKVFAMTNLEKVKVDPALIESIKAEVCRLSDKDGFGYAVVDKNLQIGGERTIKEGQFTAMKRLNKSQVTSNLPIVVKTKEAFGFADRSKAQALIAHGRYSTNTVALKNTHPFFDGDIALVHNGVVDDPEDKIKEQLTSTCDSEILLRYWSRSGFEEIPKSVTGYYAFAVLDGEGLLHIVRDSRAPLYIAWSPTVESFIIATTVAIIEGVATKNQWKVEEALEIQEHTYSVFRGNELIKTEQFQSRKEPVRYGRYGNSNRSHGWNGSDDYQYGGYGNRGYGGSTRSSTTTTETKGGASTEATPSSTATPPPFTQSALPDPNKTPAPNAAETNPSAGAIEEEPQNLTSIGDFKKSG